MDDIAICWDETENKVGLRIRGELWAAFDSETGIAYSGNNHANGRAAVPSSITAKFEANRQRELIVIAHPLARIRSGIRGASMNREHAVGSCGLVPSQRASIDPGFPQRAS